MLRQAHSGTGTACRWIADEFRPVTYVHLTPSR